MQLTSMPDGKPERVLSKLFAARQPAAHDAPISSLDELAESKQLKECPSGFGGIADVRQNFRPNRSPAAPWR